MKNNFYEMVLVLGMLWMHACHHQYDLRLPCASAHSHTIHIILLDVRDCATNFNDFGE